MNLLFKCPNDFGKKLGKRRYISVSYKLEEGERRISIVHINGDKRGDEWLRARLLQFTTSNNSTIGDMSIELYPHENNLAVEGIDFQPVPMKIDDAELEQVDDELGDDHKKYEEIVKSADSISPLLYTSLLQLKLLLSKGVLLNSGNTWFYLDDNGQHCEMISIKECLIQDAKEHCSYSSEYNSRFLVGACFVLDFKFKIIVRGQFLTPLITYTVNLVFKFHNGMNQAKGPNIFLKYKLQGQTKSSISYLADKREDDWWMVELCHFTNQGPTTDLEIIFEDNHPYIVVEGIEFLPMKLEEEEHQVLEDENLDDQQQPLSVDENGKKCLMLSPLAAINAYDLKWQSLPEPRFEGMMELLHFEIVSKINPELLSPETRYATYLVYKLPQNKSKFETLVKVMDGKGLVSNDNWDKADSWNVILVSPQIPVNVTRKFDENTSNPLKRSKIKGIPQHRSDGSMEVQVWEFQTDTTTEFIPMRLRLKMYNKWFDGLSIQGIEFRPISI